MTDTPRRISILLASYSVSGVPRVQLNLAHGIARRGYSVDFVLFSGALPANERDALPLNVRVVELHKQRVVAALPALVEYFRKERPEAVIAAEEHLNLVAVTALRISRIKASIAISFHVPPTLEASKPLWRKGRWVSLLGHWVYPRADAIVAISKVMGDTLAKVSRLPRDSIRVIHNPVVSDRLFIKARLSPGSMFEEVDAPIVLGVGSLDKRKGFLDLIEAFATLRAQRNARLVILGEGPQRPELEACVRDLGLEDDVWLPGAVDNPYAWMARAQLFVLASYFEGLPTVLIEALACGCPVVSTDCPTGPREILEDGRHGELVPMRDPEALAAAMARTLDNPLDSETLKTRAMDFHVDRIADEYLDALGFGADTTRKTSVETP
jgi:glycosyltransferase involved in cell wall biosynthesis